MVGRDSRSGFRFDVPCPKGVGQWDNGDTVVGRWSVRSYARRQNSVSIVLDNRHASTRRLVHDRHQVQEPALSETG